MKRHFRSAGGSGSGWLGSRAASRFRVAAKGDRWPSLAGTGNEGVGAVVIVDGLPLGIVGRSASDGL